MTMDTSHGLVLAIVAFGALFIYAAITTDRKPIAKTLAEIDGFTASYISRDINRKCSIAIDPETKQFAISKAGRDPLLFSFSQLVAVDVERNGTTVTTTKGNSGIAGAVVGVALLGPAGLLLGSRTRSKGVTRATVTKLSIKIYVNDLNEPCHEIIFYHNLMGGSANGFVVTMATRQLDEWYGRLRAILAVEANDHALANREIAN